MIIDDGGRELAGYKGTAGDCVCRAFAIASQRPYKEIYAMINNISKAHPYRGRKRSGTGKSSAHSGVYKEDIHRLAAELRFTWTPCMKIGSGCKVHATADELPKRGRLVLSLSKHCTAWIDGECHDTYDPTRDGTRCVYGYWTAPA